ncbi:MAG: prepilin-type N-terminal cleavage/methylation domain-containing protein [Actinobacteria bacterium]|nr:prepilin-type N-terminal cleavage/methylation domain-containing protein [Actinomycetota bacterium]
MNRSTQIPLNAGYSLVELLIVVAILSIVISIAGLSLCRELNHQEARAAAQVWQAAAAWTQVGALWRGGSGRLTYQTGDVSVAGGGALFGGGMGCVAPAVRAEANLSRWNSGDGVSVSYSGALASPDGGGSIFFDSGGGAFRVAVRPETGLTVRSWSAAN